MLLHHLFEAQVQHTPEATAVISGGHCLTYAQLNADANKLAHFLRGRGVEPETLVGVCAESSPAMVVALLAILKAGGAYLPLDPAYPPARLDFMLSDAAISMVLTQSHLINSLPPTYRRETICVDTDAPSWQSQSAANPSSGATPNNLAYVIYTSGSTGQPKGVMLAHRGIVNNLAWRQEQFPLTSADRMLQTYSFSFDLSVWAIFWPLAVGATLVLPRPGGMADSGYLAQVLADERITVAGVGPALLQILLANPEIGRCRFLRHVFCGGEAMLPGLPHRFYSLFDAQLHNVYGPTEATIDAACWTVPRTETAQAIPIGFPVTGTDFFLLDESLHPVPEGSEGELYIAGVSLARGYLHRPELTAERFLCREARLYRTGDLARRGPEGEYYSLGRMDSQIKLRGFRIELGEIEAALCAHPAIVDAVAALREDQPGGKRLAAYVVTCEPVTAAALRDFLTETLPAHMVPAAFVFLETLPLTPSGKRDRNALPTPGPEAWDRGPDFVPPDDPLQHQLVQIWEDLLSIRPLGIRDNFWELGGHSLLAARMLDKIAHACGQTLPLSALYENGTVEGLASILRERRPEATTLLSQISPAGSRRPFFYLYGFNPLGGFYCHSLARFLPPEQPFTILHPPTAPRTKITVQSMAAEYIQAIRVVQAVGPYRLGGYCGAGLVAYEMACQLVAQDEKIEFLALIEVAPINARLRLLLRRLVGSPPRILGSHSLLLPPLAALQGRWQHRRKRGLPPKPGRIEDCDRAAGAYTPLPYSGPVTLIHAGDDPETFPSDPIELWREIAPDLTVHAVPGTHLSCLLDHVAGLGECLGACLEALESQSPEGS